MSYYVVYHQLSYGPYMVIAYPYAQEVVEAWYRYDGHRMRPSESILMV